jgi:hypothetical protein
MRFDFQHRYMDSCSGQETTGQNDPEGVEQTFGNWILPIF